MEEDGEGLCAVRMALNEEESCPETPLLAKARTQIQAYFSGSIRRFDLPLSQNGSAFDLAVWRALQGIPYGEVRTYGELARLLGRPSAARAVGGACSRNPLLIVVPCHRVIAASGMLTGFSAGLGVKRKLLLHEGHGLDALRASASDSDMQRNRTE
ncbi:MAG: methylated-DNA--[Clostridia bacterium]|nr:methylated-DNA--[protein]-cysteine S-methyltransferase [Clostridia bacterium]